MVRSSCVGKRGRWLLYFGFLSHLQVNCSNRQARSSDSNVESTRVLTSIKDSTAIGILACWQSLNSFQWPGVSVINTGSILCYMTVSNRTFKMCWNTSFLNYPCKTWSHGGRLVDSHIALFLNSLTLPNVYAFILSQLLITLMCFPRLGAAFHTQTAHECA